MNSWRGWWLGTCVATVAGQGYIETQGYVPGTCTDQRAVAQAQRELTPCRNEQSTESIRSRRHRRTYHGGK